MMAALLLFIALVTALPILRIIYNLFLHPLRSFPGPFFNRASVLPKVYHLITGRLPHHVADYHRIYGPVVRIAPGELSFVDPRAWRDIYSRKGGGQYELPQDLDFYNAMRDKPESILSAGREEHDSIRKLMGPGFSDRAMKAQEPVIGGYVDLLMRRLSERSIDASGKPQAINMRDWIAFASFDVIGRLGFGSDFGCLEKGVYHPWIALIIHSVRDMAMLQAFKALGLLKAVVRIMGALGVADQKRRIHMELTESKIKQRLEMGTGHHDFLDGLIKSGLEFQQLKKIAGVLIIAGSETTATLLTGAIYFITTHPEVLRKLTAEVRSRFESEDEITLTSVNSLSYMLAVLNETLRCYPPVPSSAPRRVPPGGTEIGGYRVPENTVVGIWQWAMYHDPDHFTDPDRFDPDRFLEDVDTDKYKDDRLDAVNAFIVGPRSCLGQNLAYAEMRLILARLVWRFDMTLSDNCRDWADQLNFLLWEKPVLDIYLTQVNRATATE